MNTQQNNTAAGMTDTPFKDKELPVRDLISRHALPMKLIKITRENGIIVVYFFSENRVDFRNLVRDLNALFGEPIRLFQISPRDEARLVGGLGPCHKQVCCKMFLTSYETPPQEYLKKNSNNLSQYTGMCGKLMCCLTFEMDEKSPGRRTERFGVACDTCIKAKTALHELDENSDQPITPAQKEETDVVADTENTPEMLPEKEGPLSTAETAAPAMPEKNEGHTEHRETSHRKILNKKILKKLSSKKSHK